MSKFKRIRDVILGVFMILLALLMILLPENSLGIVVLILTVSMFAYGFRLLWFYFTMSRHMVGGKATLYRAIIVLDLALFLVSAAALSRIIVLIYLIFIFIFTGIIDILRSFEAKSNGAANWRFKMTTGVITAARDTTCCRRQHCRRSVLPKRGHLGLRLLHKPDLLGGYEDCKCVQKNRDSLHTVKITQLFHLV